MTQAASRVTALAKGDVPVAGRIAKRTAATMPKAAALLAVGFFFGCFSAFAQTAGQSTFATPEEAVKALTAAAQSKDRAALEKVFGGDYADLLSGDEVEDANDLETFANSTRESTQLEKVDDAKYTVTVGKDNWPTPIPVVEKEGKWFFDTKAGLDEVMNRRVGENELSAIATVRAYAVAQWEYFTESDWDHDSVAEYAQRLVSSQGTHNGLYWETADDATPSPLGKFVAAARAEGYGPKSAAPDQAGKGGAAKEERAESERSPYHGYYFKILTRQGPHAPGGRYSYIINGNMIAGYAMVAYPAKWGNSGVMTFVINQQGRVYQKNLGANTERLAAGMTEYNPDITWKAVDVDTN